MVNGLFRERLFLTFCSDGPAGGFLNKISAVITIIGFFSFTCLSTLHQDKTGLTMLLPSMRSQTNQRRLLLTVYRNMLRWCANVDSNIPLKEITEMESIADSHALKVLIRDSFRRPLLGGEEEEKERITEAINALRRMNELTPKIQEWEVQNSPLHRLATQLAHKDETHDDSWTLDWIDTVTWLPSLEEMLPSSMESNASRTEGNKFPLFPLSGPIYDPKLQEPLPVTSSFQEVSVPGTEIPLQIFEPRYRRLYEDLLTSPEDQRVFVVPFSHPTRPGTFASHGLLYQVTSLREVADDTNGVIQYVVNHAVTKPVRIQRILNPRVHDTRETYLQVEGTIVMDDFVVNEELLLSLERALEDWKAMNNHPLAERALTNLRANGLWGLVQTFHLHWQQELMLLQVRFATHAFLESTLFKKSKQPVSKERLLEIQGPHRERLLSIQLQLALLNPILLQMSSPEAKVNHLVKIIERERSICKCRRLQI
jgi:hypothetical protein